MAFSRFVCWTADHAAEAIGVDATESSDAVFLATHHPAHIRQRPLQQARGGNRCTEEQVRELLLRDPADPLIIPVVGQSGSGKSHLVRWLKASFATADERLHVVHIPKYDTSLKRVIERVIAGFNIDDFDEVRTRLAETRDAIIETEAPGRLLNELALSFENWRPEPDSNSDFAYDEYLAGPDGMASLLYDKVFREPLLAEGGTIRRFVSQALHGKLEVDEGEPLRFDPDDLPTTPKNVRDAAPGVQRFYRSLIGDRKLLTLAAAKLTEFLQPAVRDLIGVDAQEMGRLFQRVRELLEAEEKELILLVEDFTVLQAIQRELLDALLIPARQEGRETFCRLRAVLAVTTGYFRDLVDTVRTRVRYVLDLDVALDDVDTPNRMDFVGRYLNAARLGEDALASAVEETSTAEDQSWVPNACNDCEYKGPCHEAFGATALGHGLYPFNEAALNRCLGSQLRRPDVQDRFDPRVVLKDVIEYTLVTQRESLAHGTFPNDRFAEHFKNFDALELDAFVEQDIDKYDPSTAARRKVLLTIWGNAPRALVDLHRSIHDAFEISLYGRPLEQEPRPSPPQQPSQPPAEDTRLHRDLQDFAKWRQGTALSQSLKRKLRGLIHGAVVAHMDWERLVAVPKNWIGGGKAFSTDRILLREQPQDQSEFIYLEVDRESASDAAAIEALLKYEHFGNWSFENGARSFRSLRIVLDRWAADVCRQLEAIRDARAIAFENAIHALVLGSIVFGLVDARHSSAGELVDAIFAPISEFRSDATGSWEELRTACLQGRRDSRKDLQERVIQFAGTSKGGSGPQMIDVATILPLILEKLGDLGVTPLKSSRDGASQHLRHVLELLPRALTARRASLEEWKRTIFAWGDPLRFDAEDVVQAVLDTIDQARASSISVQPLNAFQLLKRLGAEFVSRHPRELWGEIDVGLRDFDSSSTKDRLAFLAQQQEDALRDVSRFVDASTRIIGDIERQVADESSVSDDFSSQVEVAIATLHREFELTGAALKTVAEISKGAVG